MSVVNLKSLAKELGLSVSTVSRALRDAYDISARTKEIVRQHAAQQNYSANPYASSLRKQQSKTIGVVIPNIVNNFFALAIDGIETVAQQKDYHVLIYLTHENYEKEKAILKHLQNGRVDGILMSVASETEDVNHIRDFQKHNIPIVFFDRSSHKIEAPKVSSDDYESAFRATEHLLQNGCKKVAHLSIAKHLSISEDRLRGFKDALTRNKVPKKNMVVLECTRDAQQCNQQIAKLFKTQKPDGIFASVEKLAISTYEVCQFLKLDIPADVKVISFANLPTASFMAPALSTITQPAFEIGRQAAILLFNRLLKKKDVHANERLVLQSELFARSSSSVQGAS